MAALSLKCTLCYVDSIRYYASSQRWFDSQDGLGLPKQLKYTDDQLPNPNRMHQIIRIQIYNGMIVQSVICRCMFIFWFFLFVCECDARLHRLMRFMLMYLLVVMYLLTFFNTLLVAILLLCRWIYILLFNNNVQFCVLFWHINDRVSSNRQHIFAFECINNRNEHTITFPYIAVILYSAFECCLQQIQSYAYTQKPNTYADARAHNHMRHVHYGGEWICSIAVRCLLFT